MTGVSFAEGVSAVDTAESILVDYEPVHYTPTADTVEGHLEGIDDALGALITALEALNN